MQPTQSEYSGGRRRRERGAVLVESALIMPLILLLVFGIIEWSYAFTSTAILNDATRKTGRIAAAHAGDTNLGALTSDIATEELRKLPNTALPVYLAIYESDEFGYPVDAAGNTIDVETVEDCVSVIDNCLVYLWDEGDRRFELLGGEWDPVLQTACEQPYDRVGVAIFMAYYPMTGLFEPFLKRDFEAEATGKTFLNRGPQIDHVAFVFEPEPLGAC